VVNIALSIPLGKLYGGIGCAVGTAVALLCGSVLTMNIYYYKVIHLDIPRFWREIARMTLPAACALVICFLLRGLGKEGAVLTILFNGFLYTATYVPLTWFFGMNSYERELVLLYGGKGKRLLLSLVKRRKCYD
jgi:O-antigen/teichoic acid export membrane protein